MLAFLSRETLGATIIALISCSWLANGLIYPTAPPTATNVTQGLLALTMTAILLLVGAGAVFGKPLLGVVIVLAAARFATSGLYELTASTALQTTSGILGCVIAAIALYGGLGEQVGPIESEAGNQKQLKNSLFAGCDDPYDLLPCPCGRGGPAAVRTRSSRP